MIDRLWRLWQLRHPARAARGILDEALPPFRMTVRQTLSVTALGYDYAVASSSTDAMNTTTSRSSCRAGRRQGAEPR